MIGSSFASFVWASGGGTTAAYQMSYQTGASAPASCSAGTLVSAATLGVNPSTYTVTGLSSNTQYSFRLCAANSNLSSVSSGVTVTLTTSSSGVTYNLGTNQFLFSTGALYGGDFGGLMYGDYVCQSEALAAGLSGTWKAVLSDDTTSATSRLALSTNIYNLRPGAAGGFQRVSDSNSFWGSGGLANLFNYSASGAAPASVYGWTGSSAAGASSGTTCNSWTTSLSSGTGTLGRNNVSTAYVANTTTNCGTTRTLFCINQQSSPATPSDPTSFAADFIGSTFVGLTWASGGGTTAAYQLAYQTGGTAPANCTTGTVVNASSLGVNPTSVALTGLTASTQYSFRLCAVNSDLSAFSSGQTLTLTTNASGLTFTPGSNQYLFATASAYSPNFGGVTYADFICQTEAANAGMGGVWKAIIGDDSTSADSRISISPVIYNTRSAALGGAQRIADSSTFWSGTLAGLPRYTPAGSTATSTRGWTGAAASGALNAGRTCSNWTSNSSGVTGSTGSLTSSTAWENGANSACNLNYALYCVNQQTASSAPPNPANFNQGATTTSSIAFSFGSGGGTTAGFKLSYQQGATPPADCSTGTVVPATTLGINPVAYTVTGLSSATQYSFRLCAINSDQSIESTGSTVTATTN